MSNFASMKGLILFILLVLSPLFSKGQDTSCYTLYRNKVILYSDFGFNSAPFKLEDSYQLGQNKLKFKHNLKPIVGLGIHYKWFAMRLGFGLPGHFRPVSRYGRSNYFDFGLVFSIKKSFVEMDLRNYGGYFIKDAYKWNDTLNALTPNDFRPETRAVSLSTNVYYFFSKDINMKAIYGRVGHYNRSCHAFYLKNVLSFFGVGNNGEHLIPHELIDTLKATTEAKTVSTLDLGVVPGYALVKKINNWQFVGFGGVGAVIQSKFFVTDITRGFLGLAPRIDVRFTAGYDRKNFFMNFYSDFDIKSIRFNRARYGQTFYSLKVVAGFRLKNKEERKKND